jgi:hypothetical protein
MSKLKTRTIKQADAEGRIRDKTITVAAHQIKHKDKPRWFQFAARREWEEYEQSDRMSKEDAHKEVAALITAGYEREKELALAEIAATATPGQSEIVIASIDAEMKQNQKSASSRSRRTNELLIKHSKDHEGAISLPRAMEILEATRLSYDEKDARQSIVFHDLFKDEYNHTYTPILDNLRDCHPLFAYDDLSDLDDEALLLARTLSGLALAEVQRINSTSYAVTTTGKWSEKMQSATRDIGRHTPHITHGMVELHLNHPDRVKEVLTVVAEREMPLSHADEEFIQGILTVTPVLTEGSL